MERNACSWILAFAVTQNTVLHKEFLLFKPLYAGPILRLDIYVVEIQWESWKSKQ